MKVMQSPRAIRAYIELHKRLRIPFTLVLSNYTTRIISRAYDIHFMKSSQSNKVFMAAAMIKKDVAGKYVRTIDPRSVVYFDSAPFKIDFYADKIYNIDIKSAYASILYNDGFISRKTYGYLKSLPKLDRLAAVGMLAGKKNYFEVNEYGDFVAEHKEVSPTADYFFYCVKRTSEIMAKAANYLGESFLFSWVDGIYFSSNNPEVDRVNLTRNFAGEGLKVSFETLTDFEIKHHKNFYQCSYKKEGEPKTLNVPKKDFAFRQKITEYLSQKNYY